MSACTAAALMIVAGCSSVASTAPTTAGTTSTELVAPSPLSSPSNVVASPSPSASPTAALVEAVEVAAKLRVVTRTVEQWMGSVAAGGSSPRTLMKEQQRWIAKIDKVRVEFRKFLSEVDMTASGLSEARTAAARFDSALIERLDDIAALNVVLRECIKDRGDTTDGLLCFMGSDGKVPLEERVAIQKEYEESLAALEKLLKGTS